MYLGIVLIGAAHGLIFLPVLLSYVGKYAFINYYIFVKTKYKFINLVKTVADNNFKDKPKMEDNIRQNMNDYL